MSGDKPSTVWVVVFLETDRGLNTYGLHPLCVCATEQIASVYMEYIEQRFPKEQLARIELPYYG